MSTQPANNFTVQPFTADGVVNAGDVRIRSVPSTEGNNPIKLVGSGAKVSITGKVTTTGTPADWYQIAFNGNSAYIASQWVTVITGAADALTSGTPTQVASSPVPAAPVADECPSSVLKVPYSTQIMSDGKGHDACGETSVKMVVGFYGKDPGDSVQTMANKLGKWGLTTGSNDLIKLAGLYGVSLSVLTHDNTLDAIRAQLAASKPVILLVNYKDLGFRVHLGGGYGGDPTNQGAHWFVVIGVVDKTFYVNDPLWVLSDRHGKGGACLPISSDQLSKAAAAGAGMNNMKAYLALS